MRRARWIRCAAVAAFVAASGLCPAPLQLGAQEAMSDEERRALEDEVRHVLALDSAAQRASIEPVFLLAALHAEEGRDQEAMRLYEAGLRIDVWRLGAQLQYARLLFRHGPRELAIEKARTVRDYAEETVFVDEAQRLLRDAGVTQEPSAAASPSLIDAEIVLIPMGGVRRWLLDEVRVELERALGVRIAIAPYDLPLGAWQRTDAEQYLQQSLDELRSSLTLEEFRALLSGSGVDEQALERPEAQQRVLERYTQQTGGPGEVPILRETLADWSKSGQYHGERLMDELAAAYPEETRPSGVLAYVGVMEEDMYSDGTNFVFGGARPGYGVVSYARFLARFNDESPNRPRLRLRLLKQLISTTAFALDVPRCTSPVCVRAYPHSLAEHDQKGDALCAWCRQQLRNRLQGPQEPAPAGLTAE